MCGSRRAGVPRERDFSGKCVARASTSVLFVQKNEKKCGKNRLDVCCDLTPYETSRWLELNPDLENVTRSGTGRITHGTNATPE